MRHGNKNNHLSRQKGHRVALLSNMACSLIEHKRINTTLAKAKALRRYVEPLITRGLSDDMHNRRMVFSYLQNKEAVAELFRDVAPKIGDRSGGYTRIIRLGNRLGDAAEMAMIELVDFNEVYTKEAKQSDQKRTRRSRRSGAKKEGDTEASTEAAKETKEAKSAKDEAPKAAKETKAVKDEPKAAKETKEVKDEAAKAAKETKAASKPEAPEASKGDDAPDAAAEEPKSE